MFSSWEWIGWILFAALVYLAFKMWSTNSHGDAKMRQYDREQVWPDFEFFMQDRDHAIAAMTMHMLMHEHWHPKGFDRHPSPFFVVLEQAIEETEGWGPVGAHLYNVSVDVAPEVAEKPGMLNAGVEIHSNQDETAIRRKLDSHEHADGEESSDGITGG